MNGREAEPRIKESVRQRLLGAGASEVGFARAGRTDPEELSRHREWVRARHHAGMEWIVRHAELKADTGNVLPGAATVVVAAFSYAPPAGPWREGLPAISRYAAGEDYHDALRRRLEPAIASFREEFGGEWRVCIDSAPLAERHWALKSGVGLRGKNGFVITPSCGTWCFLVEILTTVAIDPDPPSTGTCKGCGECVRACPTGALCGDGSLDARKCLNYLTIEHRGVWDTAMARTMAADAGRSTLFGCDRCQEVCPHNKGIKPTEIIEFQPREPVASLTAATAAAISDKDFPSLFRGSPIKRAKAAGLRRNALNVLGLNVHGLNVAELTDGPTNGNREGNPDTP